MRVVDKILLFLIIALGISCEEESQPRLEFTLGDQVFLASEANCRPSSQGYPVYFVLALKGTIGSGSTYQFCEIGFYGIKEGYTPLEGNYLLSPSPSLTFFGHSKIVISSSQFGQYESESGALSVKYRYNQMVVTFTDAVLRNVDDNTLKYSSGILEFNCK